MRYLIRFANLIPMWVYELLGLLVSAAAAGVINAIAGGGTLVTFPTLLYFGTPPIVANATSTLALVLGTSGSVFGYRRHLSTVKPWLVRFIPASILGGLIGSILLTQTSDRMFSRLVPFLILFATLLFLGQGFFRKTFSPTSPSSSGPAAPPKALSWAVLFQFLVAIYGGYFGAGIGILMLASLGFAGFGNIHEMNTIKTVLGSLINLVAAIWFVGAGLVHWPEALVMTVGAVAGYYLGSHFAQRISQDHVRTCVTLTGFVISIVTFYKEFLAH